MSAPSSTILFIGHQTLARADRRGADAAVVTTSARPPGRDDLPGLVEAAARLGGPLAGRVWVLAEDLFAQTVELPTAALTGLSNADISQALAFEVQTLSGTAAAEAVVAWLRAPADGATSDFWIAQIPRGEREQIDVTVARLGGRLAGILYPAGLPAPLLEAPAGKPWRRVEYWHDGVATTTGSPTTGDGRAAISTRLVRGDPNRWRIEPTTEDLHDEVLLGTRLRVEPTTITTLITDLRQPADLTRWLSAWAELVTAEAGRSVPVIRRPAKPLPRAVLVAVAAVLLVLVGGAAWFDFRQRRAEQQRVGMEIQQAQAPARRLAEAQRERMSIEEELDKLRAAAAPSSGPDLATLKRLPAIQLAAIAACRPDHVAVSELTIGLERTAVAGRCLQPAAADRFATALAEELEPQGFAVSAATKLVGAADERGHTVAFSLSLIPPSGLKAAPAAARGDE